MIVVECEQGTPEWKAARAGIPTASRFCDVKAKIKTGEAAARRDYRAELVVERLTGIPTPEGFKSAAMKDGTEREPDARALYEARRRVIVSQVGFCQHDSYLYGASPDGLVGDDGIIEIKCPKAATHLVYRRLPEGEAPAEYVPQIQGVLLVTGRAWCDFISYQPDLPERMRLVVRRVLRDPAYIATLETEIRGFVSEVVAEVLAQEAIA